MIEIHLYGKLRRFSGDGVHPGEGIVKVEGRPEETICSLLERLGIPVSEINHVFLNSKLQATRVSHAELYDLPMANREMDQWELEIAVGDHDRLGLFGRDIPMLSM